MSIFSLEYTILAIVLLFYSCSLIKALVGDDKGKEWFRRKDRHCGKPCA